VCLAIPARIVEVTDAQLCLAVVDVQGARRPVNIVGLVDDEHPPAAGQWVLVHMGFAIGRIDEEQATQTLRALSELARMQT